MKNIIWRKPAVLLLAISLGSCESFLEKEPLENFSADNYYTQDATSATEAVLGIYNSFYRDGWYKRNIWMAQEIGSDNGYISGPHAFNELNVGPTNSEITDMWRNHYDLINRAQHVLVKVPNAKMDDTEKAKLLGEAYFLQALAYFNLVRYFGGVPIIREIPTAENAFALERNTEAEINDHIISSLEKAIASLPVAREAANAGRATRGAAQTLLADVYLTMASRQNNNSYYQKVVELTGEIINSGQYKLETDYANNFYPTTENGVESIFEIQYTNVFDRGGQEFQWWASYGGGWGELRVTDDLVKAYKASNITRPDGSVLLDVRGDVTVLEKGEKMKNNAYVNTTAQHRPQKYIDFDDPAKYTFFLNSAQNTKVYRYAEVLLMRAEALNKLGQPGAVELVNNIRRRAFKQPLTTANSLVDIPAGTAGSQLDQIILNERRLEFALESKRWFDLIRTGKAVEVLSNASNIDGGPTKIVEERDLLFPIPQAQVNLYPTWELNPANY